MEDRLQVVCGIFVNVEQVAIFRRNGGNSSVNEKWEFPGGKIDTDESISQGLKREIYEELSVSVCSSVYLGYIDWDYPELSIRLHAFSIDSWLGDFELSDHSAMKWSVLDDLKSFDLAAADREIIEKLAKKITM